MATRKPQPIQQEAPEILLDAAFAKDSAARLAAMGAMNAQPPLPPSTHLKNKYTGVILPWTPMLAEQRDILVNCDENGNTDPGAWQNNLQADPGEGYERELSLQAAANLVKRPAGFMQPGMVPPRTNPPEQQQMPYGAKPLTNFFDTVPPAVE